MLFNRTALAALAALALMASAPMAATITLTNNGDATTATGVSDSLAGFSYTDSGLTTETSSIPNVTRSPFETTGAYGDNYFNLAANGYLDLTLNTAVNTFSFLWGSPDNYNFVEVLLDDATSAIFSLGNIPPVTTPGLLANFVTFRSFDGAKITGVNLYTSGTAFEFSNLSSAQVPLPAGGVLLLAALGGMGALRRRNKSA